MKARDILDALSSSEIVHRVVIIILVEEPGKQALRAKAHLKEGYVLYITEAFGEGFRSYSYHLQKDREMILRWDNAPHWPEIGTYPHHLHQGQGREDDVRESPEVFVDDVLQEIAAIIKDKGDR